MLDINEVTRYYIRLHEKAQRFGIDFEPFTEFQKVYECLPSEKWRISAEGADYMGNTDIKDLRIMLGVKDLFDKKQKTEQSKAQLTINNLFG